MKKLSLYYNLKNTHNHNISGANNKPALHTRLQEAEKLSTTMDYYFT